MATEYLQWDSSAVALRSCWPTRTGFLQAPGRETRRAGGIKDALGCRLSPSWPGACALASLCSTGTENRPLDPRPTA